MCPRKSAAPIVGVRQGLADGSSGKFRFGLQPAPLEVYKNDSFADDRYVLNDFMSIDSERVITLTDLFQISGWQHKLPWRHFYEKVEIYRLYGDGKTGSTAALLRFHPGGRVPLHEHTGYEHIFVLSGSQVDENSRAETGTLIINPPGDSHSIVSEEGCIVLAIYEKPVTFLADHLT